MCGCGAAVTIDAKQTGFEGTLIPSETLFTRNGIHQVTLTLEGKLKAKKSDVFLDKLWDFARVTIVVGVIVKMAAESFHLIDNLFKAISTERIYWFVDMMHVGAHNLSALINVTPLLFDFIRIKTDSFIVYYPRLNASAHEKLKIDYERTAARVCQLIFHMSSPFCFMTTLHVLSPSLLTKSIKVGGLTVGAIGFAIYISTLIQRRDMEEHFWSELALQAGGLATNLLSIAVVAVDFTGVIGEIVEKSDAILHGVYGALVLYKLLSHHDSSVKQEFKQSFEVQVC